MNLKYYYGIFQLFIGFLITIFIESVASGNLLFTKGILTESLRSDILSQPRAIIVSLFALNFIGYILYVRETEKETLSIVYNNICKAVFSSFIIEDNEINENSVRVTLFRAHKGYKAIGKFYSPKKTTYLKQAGRCQSTQEKKDCKIHYLPNVGCVGICYNLAQVVYKEIPTFNPKKTESYYNSNSKTFNMPKKMTKKVNTNSCAFLAVPINYFGTDDVFGVLIIDSTEKGKIKKLQTREIESKVLNYSAFFNKKDK